MWIPLAMGGGKWFRFNFLVWKSGKKIIQMLFSHRYQDKYCYLLGRTEALNDSCSNHSSINGRRGKRTWVCNSLLTVLPTSSCSLPGLKCMVILKRRSKQVSDDMYAILFIFLTG